MNDVAEPYWEPDPDDTPGWFEPFHLRVSGKPVRRITGTVASQEFWTQLPSGVEPPDLILADMNFERDNESALRGKFTEIPTGLLYAIPLLAWARTSGRLSAVTFNTGDPDTFRLKSDEAMRLLTVELGALAMALAGDSSGSAMGGDTERRVHEWIRERSFANESPAGIRGAVREYRRRLFAAARVAGRSSGQALAPHGLIIDPHEYIRLLARIATAASAEEPARPDREDWPGLSIIRSDGTRDCLSIQSLFGDVQVLEPAAFQSGRSDEPWEVRSGQPAIGDFVLGLGQWPEVFRNSVAVVRKLPQGDTALEETNLNRLATDSVVRFLAVMFQIVRQYRFADDLWHGTYRDDEWDASMLQTRSAAASTTLAGTLAWLYQQFCDIHAELAEENPQGERVLMRADLAESLSAKKRGTAYKLVVHNERKDVYHVNDAALTFHLGLLQGMDLIEPAMPLDASGDRPEAYRLASEPGRFPDCVPPCPEQLQPGWIRSGSDETGLMGALQRTLGFGEEYNPVKRIVKAAGVCAEGAEKEFLNGLLSSGACPGWLRELCRTFAVHELGWDENRHWPPFMRAPYG